MSTQPLTSAMLRELRAIATTGNPSDPMEWHGAGALWFHARDRVIGALAKRGLIEAAPDWTLTDAGHDALQTETPRRPFVAARLDAPSEGRTLVLQPANRRGAA